MVKGSKEISEMQTMSFAGQIPNLILINLEKIVKKRIEYSRTVRFKSKGSSVIIPRNEILPAILFHSDLVFASSPPLCKP